MVIEAGSHFKLNKEDVYRTPGSGGHIFASKEDPGDLVLSMKVKKIFPASVECKHYKKLELQGLFSAEGLFFKWIDQSWKSAKKQGGKIFLHPIVVFKWNGSKIFTIYPSDAFTLHSSKVPYMRFFYKNRYWRMALFSDLLATVFKKEYGKKC